MSAVLATGGVGEWAAPYTFTFRKEAAGL